MAERFYSAPPAFRATLSAMDHGVTTIERAFQLAKSGSYASVADIKKRLSLEGYSIAQITGGVLTGQLRALIKAAREARRAWKTIE
jgi:hypothetical protein